MYKISELAKQVGMSRTALLYYEKQNLISGHRLENGYRSYTQKDVQRVRLIQQLQAGGLTLQECKACLETKLDKAILKNRLNALDIEIEQKQKSRNLLAALLGEGELKTWHEKLNKVAPDIHTDWLIRQGFEEKEALRLKWLSKDMNEHDRYMADFMRVFRTLERWGPGSVQDTLRALKHVPTVVEQVLEIGCGKGQATQVLAQNCAAHITAIDNEQVALNVVLESFEKLNLTNRITTACTSMTELNYPNERFDLIWSEGSAYIMGVENALHDWKPLLAKSGVLVLSDLIWRTDTPSKRANSFWQKEYPDMKSLAARLIHFKNAGYRLIEHFPLSDKAWENYYGPLHKRVESLKRGGFKSPVLDDLEVEIDIFTQYQHEFGYHMFILSKL
ncbi:MerR family transcriptional regulator [Pseudoalteromonas luteoviolacea]|uniref:MerR family transcriptional regulator n=1 Tax=Pseudoalteromonas luteoviolacea TaxID=43657 RepID=UPI001B37127B|nr:MerR family transcriptional regulator [Pseudoalteromonas luteoviolacea]MBQ4810138.1 MerR family transcriptional regulator [Pseudoalteromonas luteoviolacea]